MYPVPPTCHRRSPEVYKTLRDFERGIRDRSDDRELVVEFADGTRLLVRADERLDISVS
jgi:hypothetical protein